MRNLLIFFFATLAYTQANCQTKYTNFSGAIINLITREALPGASIYIPDLKRGTITDNNGKFIFKNVPEGNHLLEISHTGFTSYIEHVFIADGKEYLFELKPAIAENNEVVVTGVSSATSLRKMTTPVAVMRKQELLQTASSNIIDALTKKPGIQQLSTGSAISKPVIRGLGYNRVVMINDGLRQEGQQWGDEHGIEVDEYSIQKAEILKGPSSLLYGSDAIAGVINLITNTPVAEGIIKGNLFSNYQTNNQQRGFFGNIAGNKNGFTFHVYGSYKAAADYKNGYDGTVFNSKFNEKNAGGFVGFNKKWGYSHLVFSQFNQKPGLIEGERQSDGKFLKYAGTSLEAVAGNTDFKSIHPFIPYQHILHQKLVSDNRFILKKGKLNVNIGVQRNQRMEYGDAENVADKELHFDLKTLNYSVQYLFKVDADWNLTVGASGMNQQNTNRGLEAIIPDYQLNDAGVFIFTQKKIKQLNFSGGLRYDLRKVTGYEMKEGNILKFNLLNRTFSNISASAGITYEFPKAVLVRFNLARGFRAPNFAELSSNGAHEGTNRFEVGNKKLQSETSFQADAGIEVNTEHIGLSASFFYNSIQHFIYFEKVPAVNGADSVIVVNGESFYLFRFVQQNASFYGMEFTFDIHPHPYDWLHFENSFSIVRGQLKTAVDGSRNVPNIPAARFLSELRFDLFQKKTRTVQNTYLKFEMEHNFAQQKVFTAFNTETSTGAYTLWNAGLGTDVMHKGKTRLSVYFVATNLGNLSYQQHLSRLKYLPLNPLSGRTGVFNMGRNFSFKLNIPLDFSHKKKEANLIE